MIEYIKGHLEELMPAQAIIETSGIGYALSISLNTYSAIQGKETAKLYVYESIREDAYLLFGFASREERELFLLLIGVSGIGGQTARMILSAFTPTELTNIISGENVRALKSVKGIGPKAAQRIIVDLKDKIITLGSKTLTPSANNGNRQTNNENAEEAISALTMLGFSPAPVSKIVLQITREKPETAVEEIIKMALKML